MSSYIGRFAPSPTGPLHFGSLVSALVSYLEARASGGIWRVRIEDLDPPRELPGAADCILTQLEFHGLLWDGEVLFQSARTEAYHAALEILRQRDWVYPCTCSRQQLQNAAGYHGPSCHLSSDVVTEMHALRVKVREDTVIEFADAFQGIQRQNVSREVGDFVLRRKDGFCAYQLAVVVDDAYQNISHVIRGSDLLDSTARQIYLQTLLGLPTPIYGHHPVVLNSDGQKLSKQNLSPEINNQQAASNLLTAMQWLAMPVPAELHGAPCKALLVWAVEHWRQSSLIDMPDTPVE